MDEATALREEYSRAGDDPTLLAEVRRKYKELLGQYILLREKVKQLEKLPRPEHQGPGVDPVPGPRKDCLLRD